MYNSIYPVKINPYTPQRKQQQVNAAGEEASKSSQAQKEERALSQSENRKNKNYERQEYPNGQKTQIDYSKCKVNIAQIITDFKNTAQAIGTPDYIVEEVDMYLALAQTQSEKDEPNKKLIQANLKNASTILDDFISKTLNKNSKVVENWVDALFLQQVDYKSDPSTINPDFLVKLPDKDNNKVPVSPQKTQAPPQTQKELEIQEVPSQPAFATPPSKETKVYIPKDPELKKAFIQGKKAAAANDAQKALSAFGTALSLANDAGDLNAASMVCFEIGQIYDKEDNLAEALKYYKESLENTPDNNLKVRAYYSMAQIYNDVVYFEPAMEHYFAAISYAGEAENLNAQTKALGDIAGMYAERYDKNNTKTFINAAKEIAAETKNNKTMAAIYSKSGDTMKMLEENVTALNDYKESAKFYNLADSQIKVAKNYEKAAFVMLKLGNTTKAKSLLQKAYKIAYRTTETSYAQELAAKISTM